MKNYFVKKINDKTFKAVERSTGYVLKTCSKYEQALKWCSKWNSGAGWNGETPSFFINKKEQIK